MLFFSPWPVAHRSRCTSAPFRSGRDAGQATSIEEFSLRGRCLTDPLTLLVDQPMAEMPGGRPASNNFA